MIINTTGLIDQDLYVTGMAWSPTYLVNAGTPLLFEAGFYPIAPVYFRDIRAVIGNRQPSYLFLTHVHYDHCGSASYFRAKFPDMKICTSKRAAEILKRPNAIDLMTSLSRNFEHIAADLPGIDRNDILHTDFEPFTPDIVFDREEVFEAGPSLHVQVLVTPGHTRDMLSFYIPERKILIATESAGCRSQTGEIITEFLVNFDAYIQSLERLSRLECDIVCQGHHFVYTGDDVKHFFEASLRSALAFRDHVTELLEAEHNNVEMVVERIKKEEYDPNPGPKQPEAAYLLNLKTRISHLAGLARAHKN
jgi:glyoxylase-like metal-dependent hydrolase (beta-lactamase superfamily II)